jgi:hypothetical protein
MWCTMTAFYKEYFATSRESKIILSKKNLAISSLLMFFLIRSI